MTGGGGADGFLWKSVGEIGWFNFDPDIVTDYSSAQGDVLHFTFIDANDTLAGNQDFTFISTAAFTAPGQINWFTNGTDTFIQLNTNADLTSGHHPAQRRDQRRRRPDVAVDAGGWRRASRRSPRHPPASIAATIARLRPAEPRERSHRILARYRPQNRHPPMLAKSVSEEMHRFTGPTQLAQWQSRV